MASIDMGPRMNFDPGMDFSRGKPGAPPADPGHGGATQAPRLRTGRAMRTLMAGAILAFGAAATACSAQEGTIQQTGPQPGQSGAPAISGGTVNVADLQRAQNNSMAAAGLVFPNQSGLGSYLAGRIARADRDTQAATRFYQQALASDPGNPALARRTFILLLADGQFEQARALAPFLEQSGEEASVVALLHAVDAIREERPADAIEAIDSVPATGFVTLLAPLVRGWARLGQGDPDAGLEEFDRLGETPGLSLFADYHRALLLDTAGRDEAAVEAYGKVLAGGRSAAIRSEAAYGLFLESRGRHDEAELFYESDIGLLALEREAGRDRVAAGLVPAPLVSSPADGVAEALYGAAAVISREDPGEAVEMYIRLALLARPEMAAAHMLLGDLLESRGRFEQAVQSYRRVPATSPYRKEALLRAAWSLNRLDRRDEAEAILRQMAAEDPYTLDPLVTLGDIFRERERFTEAAAIYSQAVDRIRAPSTRHWPLYYSRGIAYERARNWDAAERDFLKALELQPDQPYVLNYLGYSWVDRGMRLEEARDMIVRAVAARPDDGYIVDSLGWALYRLGDFEGAVRHLERAVELSPSDPTINDHLGDAYWQVGRRAEARFQWRRTLTLDPPEEIVDQVHEKIRDGMPPVEPPPRRAADGG